MLQEQTPVIYYGTIIRTFVLQFHEYMSSKILESLNKIIFENILGNKNLSKIHTTRLFQLMLSECLYNYLGTCICSLWPSLFLLKLLLKIPMKDLWRSLFLALGLWRSLFLVNLWASNKTGSEQACNRACARVYL